MPLLVPCALFDSLKIGLGQLPDVHRPKESPRGPSELIAGFEKPALLEELGASAVLTPFKTPSSGRGVGTGSTRRLRPCSGFGVSALAQEEAAR